MNNNNQKQSGKISLVILSLVAPFLLLPIQIWLPYPAIVEELLKFALINWWVKVNEDRKGDWVYAVIAGTIFAISESVLYLDKIILLDNLWLYPQRVVLTVALHTTTMFLIFIGIRRGLLISHFFLFIAILIHWFFNIWVMSF